MNIVVIGAGGVGGYFGGKLAQAGFNVTFIVRGKTHQAIKTNGLKVLSVDGDFTVHPKATDNYGGIKNPDLIILGVKSWQIEAIAKELKDVITKNTMVLPLQNGADNADRLRNILPHENVLAGLCKIVSKIETPGVINHFAFEPEIVFGEYDSELTSRVKKVKSAFDKAGFKSTISKNIQLDIWKKFLFITTISGIGAITRAVYGEIRKDNELRQIMYQTANEIVAIANIKGIELTNDDIELILRIIDNFNHGTTASMQRDVMAGRPSELENFNGYIVKQGKELHISTPANAFIYHCLLPQERKARGLC
ncbi:ketopantoate reductase family protein [Pontimicrobium aquaticum]|uniref:2-dehydropantoate 2-reductase n=1 Tax=Pontimicrobium aquaticum TaxID=2565367 RepID=A0A4U0F0U0_9FLAO|nr:2-dehydropantoate 2-reductase [Pontimicrobium aquaticum]TJY37983.1 2-dehydropantoate 2-reductase [Pontimicrobium aquaticum]